MLNHPTTTHPLLPPPNQCRITFTPPHNPNSGALATPGDPFLNGVVGGNNNKQQRGERRFRAVGVARPDLRRWEA